MVRKFGYVKLFQYVKIHRVFLKKRKQLFNFNIIKQITDNSNIDLDGYLMWLYFINVKNLNFCFKTKNSKEFFSFYLDNYLNKISSKFNEKKNNYFTSDQKYHYYARNFLKYKFISKNNVINLVRKKTPKNFYLLNVEKKNKYSLNKLSFLFFSFYIQHYFKFRKSIALLYLKKIFYKLISFVFKIFIMCLYSFFKNNVFDLNKMSAFFFDQNSVIFCKVVLKLNLLYMDFRLYFWRFHGVYQLENVYIYFVFFFFKEIDFLEMCLTSFIYKNIFFKFLEEKSSICFYIKNKSSRNLLSYWIFGKKNKFFKNKKKIKIDNLIFLTMKQKIIRFFMLYIVKTWLISILNQRKDLVLSLNLRKNILKIKTIKYGIYLYPFYRENFYFHGFHYLFRKKYKGNIIFGLVEKKRIYKKRIYMSKWLRIALKSNRKKK